MVTVITIAGIVCFFILVPVLTFWMVYRRAVAFRDRLNKVFANLLDNSQIISKPCQLTATDSLATVMIRRGLRDNTISGELADKPVSIEWYLGKINLVFFVRIPTNNSSEMEFTAKNRSDLLSKLPSTTQKNLLSIFDNTFVNTITFRDGLLTLQLESFGKSLVEAPNVLCDGSVGSWFRPADEAAATNINRTLKDAVELAGNFPN